MQCFRGWLRTVTYIFIRMKFAGDEDEYEEINFYNINVDLCNSMCSYCRKKYPDGE